MDKLPCSTSFLMSINFDGLKEVIEFLHKNINIINEKIKDFDLKFKGFDDVQNQLRENKIKTESGLRLLSGLEQSMNNYSHNIMDNSQKISKNKENLDNLKIDIEKIKLDNKNLLNNVKKLSSNLNVENKGEEMINMENISDIKDNNDYDSRLNSEIEKIRNEFQNNFEKVFEKVEELDSKINDINNQKIKEDEKPKNIENEEKKIKENLYEELSEKIKTLEEKMNKISEEKTVEINPTDIDKIEEIKNIPLTNAENNIVEKQEIKEIKENKEKEENNISKKNDENKLKEIEEKLSKLESYIFSLQIKDNVNNNNENQNINQEIIIKENEKPNDNIFNNIINFNKDINKKEENYETKNNNGNITQAPNINQEENKKINSLENKLFEINSHLDELKNKITPDKIMGKNEFIKYSQKIEIQLKDFNDKINNLLSKDSLNAEALKKISTNTHNNNIQIPKYIDVKENKNQTSNIKSAELIETIESNTRSMIIEYIRNLDISQDPKILSIEKELETQSNSLNEISTKQIELSNENNNQNKKLIELFENTKKELENNIHKIEEKIYSVPLLREEIELCQSMIYGKEEGEKYQKMTLDERKNEISLSNSIKEELNIHGDYLKKLSEGINKINNRINNLNKENLALIKKDLKKESNFILEDFKTGLKGSINKIEEQLKDKVDKLGLDQFWNKINEQLIEEMKQKIDKKELNKNNIYLKKKIDSLESKISRTFVDTLIDLQMDEAPLLVKKNFREINEQKCASCGQNIINNNNGLLGFSLDFNNYGNTQHKSLKTKNVNEKDKLPEIKTNIQK